MTTRVAMYIGGLGIPVALAVIAIATVNDGHDSPKSRVPDQPRDTIEDVPLSPHALKALDVVLWGYVRMVLVELEKVGAEQPVAAVGLMPGQDSGLDVTPDLMVASVESFEELVRDGESNYWAPELYPLTLQPSFDEPPAEMVAAWRTLNAELEKKVFYPQEWVLARVARVVNRKDRQDLPCKFAAQGVVFVPLEGMERDSIRFSAPPSILGRLEDLGYL